ncbi:MAG TPA: DUF1800 family protein [Ktedonobacterales bacterium]|jgi:uncharacterized protein (DUF1800 family)
MNSTDPAHNQQPPGGEQPGAPQPFWEDANSDFWLRQTAPTRIVDSQPPGGSIVVSSGANSGPPRWQALRRGGPRVSRRTLLVGAGIAGIATVAVAAGVGVYSLAGSERNSVAPAGAQQIAHLLRRAGFGAAPGEIETYSALGINGAVDRLLNFHAIPNTLMDQRIAAARFDFNNSQDILRWWLARIVYSAHPLEEKMTLFWHGLLTSSFRKVGGQRGFALIKQNNDFLRKNAFARFDDILAGITIDPAMLHWLDGNNSRAGSPNENFAREEMELFSMGVGNYTQTDIEQSARALTGWRVNPLTSEAVLIPRLHDNGQKTFLGQKGAFDYKDIARIICAQAVTPKFLATRLWRFFAYENPGAADIQPLVDAYHSSNHSIAAMMQALLTSPAFYSPQAYRARIKSPVEFVAGAFRNLGLSSIEQGKRNSTLGALTVMGQGLYNPPNVAGWPGDQVSASWINTGAWMTRINTVNALVAYMNASPDFMRRLQSDIEKQQIKTPERFVDYALMQLIDGQIDSARRQMLIDYLNSGANGGGAGVKLVGGKSLSGGSVRGLYYLILSMPEYQLD